MNRLDRCRSIEANLEKTPALKRLGIPIIRILFHMKEVVCVVSWSPLAQLGEMIRLNLEAIEQQSSEDTRGIKEKVVATHSTKEPYESQETNSQRINTQPTKFFINYKLHSITVLHNHLFTR